MDGLVMFVSVWLPWPNSRGVGATPARRESNAGFIVGLLFGPLGPHRELPGRSRVPTLPQQSHGSANHALPEVWRRCLSAARYAVRFDDYPKGVARTRMPGTAGTTSSSSLLAFRGTVRSANVHAIGVRDQNATLRALGQLWARAGGASLPTSSGRDT
jgi:hypothetical protein